MNYYNPYYFMAPMTTARPGLFGLLRGSVRGINLSSIINGTQRTLGLVNQAIPVIKQITPVMRNAKTMFKVMNEFKKVDSPTSTTNNSANNSANNVAEIASAPETNNISNSGPTFFV